MSDCPMRPSAPALKQHVLSVQVAFPSVGPVGQGKVLDAADIAEAPRVTVEEQQVAIDPRSCRALNSP